MYLLGLLVGPILGPLHVSQTVVLGGCLLTLFFLQICFAAFCGVRARYEKEQETHASALSHARSSRLPDRPYSSDPTASASTPTS